MQNRIINKRVLEYIVRHQKNIAMMVLAISAIFLVFWLFVYSPKKKQMEKFKLEYETVKKDIKDIESMTGGKTIDASLSLLDNKLKMLERKLPLSEEITLKELSAAANNLGLDVISLTPKNVEKSSIQGNTPGFQCMELSIVMDLNCTYKTLGEYLSKLQQDFPTFVRIKSVSMTKEKIMDKKAPALRVNLELTVYMLYKL